MEPDKHEYLLSGFFVCSQKWVSLDRLATFSDELLDMKDGK
jgi:hypothetical protein